MSRTYKKTPRGNPWNKESPIVKRLYRRQYRARCSQALREGRYDLMPLSIHTGGWLTW